MEILQICLQKIQFEMKPHWEKIHPKLSQKVKDSLIDNVTLYPIDSGPLKPVNSNTSSSNGIVRIAFTAQFNRLFRPNNTQQYGAFFLSIKFNGEKLKKAHPGFEDYDYSSPWNIQVGIYDGKDEEVDFSKTGPNPSQWQIMRHTKFGEVPSFKWRKRKLKREYSCSFPLKH